jgi:hypothetical protein
MKRAAADAAAGSTAQYSHSACFVGNARRQTTFTEQRPVCDPVCDQGQVFHYHMILKDLTPLFCSSGAAQPPGCRKAVMAVLDPDG